MEKRERNMFSAPSERFMKQKIVKELKLVQRLVVIKLPTFITLSLSLHCFYPNLTGKDIHSLQNVWSSFFVWIVFRKTLCFICENTRARWNNCDKDILVNLGLDSRQCWGGFNICLLRTSLPYFSVFDDPDLVGSFFNLKKLKVRRRKNCDDRHIYLC